MACSGREMSEANEGETEDATPDPGWESKLYTVNYLPVL